MLQIDSVLHEDGESVCWLMIFAQHQPHLPAHLVLAQYSLQQGLDQPTRQRRQLLLIRPGVDDTLADMIRGRQKKRIGVLD